MFFHKKNPPLCAAEKRKRRALLIAGLYAVFVIDCRVEQMCIEKNWKVNNEPPKKNNT